MAKGISIAGVLLKNIKGQYLLVQERKTSVYGLWNWPAGHVDAGETLQEAAVREAQEETGLKVKLVNSKPLYVGPGDRNTEHVVHLFEGEVIGGKLKVQTDELLNAKWFSVDKIKELAKQKQTRGAWVLIGVSKIEMPASP